MVGVISQLTSQPGKAIQEFVKEKTKVALHGDRDLLKQQKNIVCSVVHAIPGRMRWRILRIAEDSEYLERLEALLKTDPLVKSDRINTIAASIVIQYEPSEISDEQMRSHLFSLINSASDITPTQSPTQISSSPEPARHLVFACSLEIRQAILASECCGLLVGKSGEPLKGGALKARRNKLHRLGILI